MWLGVYPLLLDETYGHLWIVLEDASQHPSLGLGRAEHAICE
jgi:hypothetical protein